MRASLLLRKVTVALAALGLSGCVSSSLPADARDVRDLLAGRSSNTAFAGLTGASDAHSAAPLKPPDHPLTEADIVPLALANNREVWAALHELGVARGLAQQAGLLPNPELELGLRAPSDAQPLQAAQAPGDKGRGAPPPTPRLGHGGPAAVVTPNGKTLPLRAQDGVKIGHLVAMPVKHSFAPGLDGEAWGYNGGTPGPTIECFEGDRLRIYVTNRLPEATSAHWHGLIVPNGMDGVAGLTQKPIRPGETFMYEFSPDRPGTFMYHPHYDEMTQMALGMMGMIVVHPRSPRGPRVDRDFALLTHEWMLRPGAKRPDPNAMADFNILTFNSKVFPATDPLVIGKGERVRLRFGNLSAMDHHPIHLHGLTFEMTGTDGGEVPPAARHPETTILVPVGTTRTIEFVANEPGDWAMHCHMTHHVMTQMGHGSGVMVGADAKKIDEKVGKLVPSYMTMGQSGMGEMAEMGMPSPKNSAPMGGGAGPFSYIDMGGMFTILKVRDDASKEDGKGWYAHPKGTVAAVADPEKMKRDGIDTAAKG